MATLLETGFYNNFIFFDTSGNWTSPAKCSEALLVANGGSGGGSGASCGHTATPFAGGYAASGAGGNGGTTTFSGLNLSKSWPGGVGGAAIPVRPSTTANIPAIGGLGGKGAGNQLNGSDGSAAGGGPANSTEFNVLNLIVTRGGIGGMYFNGISAAQSNGGIGGAGAAPSPAQNWAGGGGGGSSLGIFTSVDIIPNSVYAITVGSGGNGGAGAAPNLAPNQPVASSGGGGGSGGFVGIYWNE